MAAVAYAIFECITMNKDVPTLFEISLKCVPNDSNGSGNALALNIWKSFAWTDVDQDLWRS